MPLTDAQAAEIGLGIAGLGSPLGESDGSASRDNNQRMGKLHNEDLTAFHYEANTWKVPSRKGRYLRLLDFYSAWLAGDIAGGLGYRILGDLDVIDYTGSARCFGHPGC